MKAYNQDTPYVFERNINCTWSFHLPYVNFEDFMSLAMEQVSVGTNLHLILHLLIPIQSRNDEMTLLNKLKQKHKEFQFNTSRLISFTETILRESIATQLTPLIREPGKIVLTNQRLYFQPMHNISGSVVVRSHPLSRIAAIAKRRSSLQHTGLEVFVFETRDSTWESTSAFFSFENTKERDLWIKEISKRIGNNELEGRVLDAKDDDTWIMDICKSWQYGKVSNFEYLLFLNLASGRTFNDLAQWPVFPWIISDYKSDILDLSDPRTFRDLSKPIGALNPERLHYFQKRYQEMANVEEIPHKFLYGTHYSTPGYVMFWLVRSAPAHMLQLQNGKFDSADRLFSSIKESWYSVTHNQADLKELIPEFFLSNTDFLLNKADLALGKKQNGTRVDDVELPPWARDPLDFLSKHRCALESPYVSQNLHLWIDLIFGFKQLGKAALEADNLFYYLCYEENIDMENVDDVKQRESLEAQINEFGQTPSQLFTERHPARIVIPETPEPATVFGTVPLSRYAASYHSNKQSNSSGFQKNLKDENKALSLTLLHVLSNHKQDFKLPEVRSAEIASDESREKETGELRRSFSSNVSSSPISQYNNKETTFSHIIMNKNNLDRTKEKSIHSDIIEKLTLNEFENTKEPLTSNVNDDEYERKELNLNENWKEYIPDKMQAEFEFKFLYGAVNAVAISDTTNDGIVFSTGDCSGLRLFSLRTGDQLRSTRITKNENDLSEFPFSSIALLNNQQKASEMPLVLLGSNDNSVYVYSVDHGKVIGFFEAHDDIVSGLKVTYTKNGLNQNRLITASWDCTVKIWSISDGRAPWSVPLTRRGPPEIEITDHESSIWDLAVSTDGQMLATGTDEGIVSVWDLRCHQRPIWQKKHSNDYIGGITFMPSLDDMVITTGNGEFSLLSNKKSGDCIKKIKIGQPLKKAVTDGTLCMAGALDGKMFIWNVSDAEDEKESTVHSMETKSRTAVNDVCVRRMCVGGEEKLVVVTGHDDGCVSVITSHT